MNFLSSINFFEIIKVFFFPLIPLFSLFFIISIFFIFWIFPNFQFFTDYYNLNFFSFGHCDSFVSLSLVFLTIFIFSLISQYYQFRLKLYNAYVLLLVFAEIILIFSFLTTNIFYFYICFEIILIPFYFIVAFWGSRIARIGSAIRLLLFTLFFSTPFTALIFYNYSKLNFSFEFDMMIPCLLNLSPAFQIIFYLSAFFAFGVKIPLFPMHIWLPEAHGEAPTYGSILLAGILLKLGGYGFYKFFSPGFSVFSPESETNFFPLVYTISVITIIYSTIMVFSQIDIKKTIAYYSVGHMGFVTLGFGSGFLEGEMGAVFIMLAHGLSSSGLFFLIGYIYEQLHTRSIYAYRGLSSVIPYFSLYLFIFLCANASVPGTINFIGEQLVLFSLAKLDITLLFLPALGLVLNGLSTFLFIIKLIFGEINYSSATLRDLNSPSFYFSLALSVPLILFGFMPNFLLAAVY